MIEQARCSIISPMRAATYATLIGLLAASGMRVGEAITLDRGDINWAEGVLLIRESKFGKSRLVPLHASSMAALRNYAGLRDQLAPRPDEPSFFISLARKRLLYAVVCANVPAARRRRRCRSRRGPPSASPRPAAHLRGRAPCSVGIARGGRAGRCRRCRPIWGIASPRSTYWYLSAAPELLALAARARTPRGPEAAVMTLIAPTLQAFFTDRLIQQRQASPRTIASYRDTLRLLLGFVHQQTGKCPPRWTGTTWTPR